MESRPQNPEFRKSWNVHPWTIHTFLDFEPTTPLFWLTNCLQYAFDANPYSYFSHVVMLSLLENQRKKLTIHAQIQEFSSGGGVQVSLTKKKALTTYFFFLVLSLLY